MVAHVGTVAFLGLEARRVDVQVQISSVAASLLTVGLPDKAVKESRERVQAALHAIGLALPPRRVVVNLSPADLPKESSHYDLPIALGLLVAMGIVAGDALDGFLVIGELGLDGRPAPVPGVFAGGAARRRTRTWADLPGITRRRGRLGWRSRCRCSARSARAA